MKRLLQRAFALLPASIVQRYARWRARTRVKTVGEGEMVMTYTMRPYDALKSIFIRIPKNASNSICHAIFECAGGGHTTAEKYRELFGSDYDEYFVFSFARNPYTRLVSAYDFLMKGGLAVWPEDRQFRDEVLSQYDGFEDFVLNGLEEASRQKHHFRPQIHYLTIDGELAVDYIGRVENIKTDFRYVCACIGVEADLPKRNVTKGDRPPIPSYFTSDKVARRVIDVYGNDFEALDYPVEVPSE